MQLVPQLRSLWRVATTPTTTPAATTPPTAAQNGHFFHSGCDSLADCGPAGSGRPTTVPLDVVSIFAATSLGGSSLGCGAGVGCGTGPSSTNRARTVSA